MAMVAFGDLFTAGLSQSLSDCTLDLSAAVSRLAGLLLFMTQAQTQVKLSVGHEKRGQLVLSFWPLPPPVVFVYSPVRQIQRDFGGGSEDGCSLRPGSHVESSAPATAHLSTESSMSSPGGLNGRGSGLEPRPTTIVVCLDKAGQCRILRTGRGRVELCLRCVFLSLPCLEIFPVCTGAQKRLDGESRSFKCLAEPTQGCGLPVCLP